MTCLAYKYIETLRSILVGHYNQPAFTCVFIRLYLIVLRVDASAIAEEEQEFGGRVGIIAWFRDVYLDP